jgi:hypothetical protein
MKSGVGIITNSTFHVPHWLHYSLFKCELFEEIRCHQVQTIKGRDNM